MSEPKTSRPKSPFFSAIFASLLIVFFFWSKPPVTIAFDPHDEKCLPDFHVGVLVHRQPKTVQDGDYLFWKPSGTLRYVNQEFVLKRVAGVPGDRLVIKGRGVYINGKLAVSGLPLSDLYRRTPKQLERDEVIPPGQLFVIGTHPNSDDSRYWGYLDLKQVEGVGYKLF